MIAVAAVSFAKHVESESWKYNLFNCGLYAVADPETQTQSHSGKLYFSALMLAFLTSGIKPQMIEWLHNNIRRLTQNTNTAVNTQ